MRKTWATRYKEHAAGPEREVETLGYIYELINENGFDAETRIRITWWLSERVRSDVEKEKAKKKRP